MVQDLWIPSPNGTRDFVGVLFMKNLSRVKQATITWAHARWLRDEQDLRDCEFFLDQIINRPSLGFLDQVTKDEVISCEARRRKILGGQRSFLALKK